ncbi:MAG: hypothetical protein HY447_01680 [Candidatus Omnitrophica bacterium]|nr:hypothetical protein [Candidatus Omnitrophota bacterium]
MKRESQGLAGSPDLSWLGLLLLVLALISFGFDLYHFSHHIGHDPTLLGLPQVPIKLAWKIALVLLTLILLSLTRWMLLFVVSFGFMLEILQTPLFAAMTRESCERARELMKESGIARDAKEDFLGRVKIKPPRSSFPPEMDKVTWWGAFKPFEFWESPEFQAVWINPQGQEVERQPFRGGKCQLAKTSLPTQKLPRGRLEPGMWRVIVSCEDVIIDNHPFAVVGSQASGKDAGDDTGVMIWADDINK